MTTQLNDRDISNIVGLTPNGLAAFRELFVDTASTKEAVAGTVQATGSIQAATVLTLSSNAAFANERVVSFNNTQFLITDGGAGGQLTIALANPIGLNGGFQCTFNLAADTNLDLPTSGKVPSSAIGPYADDAGAAAAGVNVGEWYAKTGGTVSWRQV